MSLIITLCIINNYYFFTENVFFVQTMATERKEVEVYTPFRAHMTYPEALQLNVGDLIDHRTVSGRYVLARITRKDIIHDLDTNRNLTRYLIHYVDKNPKWLDYWPCYNYLEQGDLWRFATANTNSKRLAHRLCELALGDKVMVKAPYGYVKEWTEGEIWAFDNDSAQVFVGFKYVLPVWVHADNPNEIKECLLG